MHKSFAGLHPVFLVLFILFKLIIIDYSFTDTFNMSVKCLMMKQSKNFHAREDFYCYGICICCLS